jgi:hypothetical protein
MTTKKTANIFTEGKECHATTAQHWLYQQKNQIPFIFSTYNHFESCALPITGTNTKKSLNQLAARSHWRAAREYAMRCKADYLQGQSKQWRRNVLA